MKFTITSLAFLAVLGTAQVTAATPEENPDARSAPIGCLGWSLAVNGLRARLSFGEIKAYEEAPFPEAYLELQFPEVYLELQNVSNTRNLKEFAFNAMKELHLTLSTADGKRVPDNNYNAASGWLLLAWAPSASVQAQDTSGNETNPDNSAAKGAIHIPPGIPMKDQLALINSALARFKDGGSADDLESTKRVLEHLTDGFSSTDRDDLAATWLNLASAVHECIDPAFSGDNPRYIGFLHLVPPADSDGIVYPAGVPPSVIKDATARAKYETALRKNAENIARSTQQLKLRYVYPGVAFDIECFRRRYYDSPTDRTTFDRLVNQSNLRPAKKARFSDWSRPIYQS